MISSTGLLNDRDEMTKYVTTAATAEENRILTEDTQSIETP